MTTTVPAASNEFWSQEIAICNLPDWIAADIRENKDEPDLVSLTRLEAIDAYLEWNGIYGYTKDLTRLFIAIINEGKLP